jgi:pimeloyl-ACP methyl ester carboxylesterase
LVALTRRLIGRISLLLGTALCTGCATFLQPPKAPIPLAQYIERSADNRTLLVFLPGIDDEAGDFARQGFIDAVRRRNLPVDMVSVDAHFGYYMSKTLVPRLQDDVITKAKRQGYERIWLVGISLGGLGSLLYSKQYPGEVYGIIVLAPYLGEEPLIEEIRAAGGPARWQPGPSAGDFRRSLWDFLGGYEQAPERMPRLLLAYGTGDRYAAGQDLLAQLLPPQQVITQSGGHRWETWRSLWESVLDHAQLTPDAPSEEQEVLLSQTEDPLEPRARGASSRH